MDCTLQKCCTFLAACVFDVLITMCWCPETPFAPPGPTLHAVAGVFAACGCRCGGGCVHCCCGCVRCGRAAAAGLRMSSWLRVRCYEHRCSCGCSCERRGGCCKHRCGCGPLSRRPSLILCNNRCCNCCCCCTLLLTVNIVKKKKK